MAGRRLGLIVNPIAGMGGAVGLKGTDGVLAERAQVLGARPSAAERAVTALRALEGLDVEIHTCSGAMGAEAAGRAGLKVVVVLDVGAGATTSADTQRAATLMRERNVDLLLIVGGDGTARDVLSAVHGEVPVLGVPAGVKMHSAVFAATARTAGDVARLFLCSANPSALLHDAEVMDRESTDPESTDPESTVRESTDRWDERGSPRLYGVMRTPKISFFVPHAKAASVLSDEAALSGAVRRVARLAQDDRVTLLGPGTTLQRVKTELDCAGSVLGVAAVRSGRCLARDAGETEILELLGDRPARLVVGVVGGQGFLFGRGNQQFSPRVIRAVGLENVVVVASVEKLLALDAGALLVDTGDEELDDALAGFTSIVVSANRTLVFPVRNAGREIRQLAAGASI